MASQDPSILRPIPRRAFELTPASTESSAPSTPNIDRDPNLLDPKSRDDGPPSRSRSILNLTSSTLFGIYASPRDFYGDRDEPSTPWGTGAETPSRRQSWEDTRRAISRERMAQRSASYHGNHLGFKNFVVPLAFKAVLLFIFGVAYGVIVTHLHDNHNVAPVRVEGFERTGWGYLIFWGIAGVGLGSLLPWVDLLWEDKLGWDDSVGTKSNDSNTGRVDDEDERSGDSRNGLLTDWNPVVRSVGAFVGIAFAIRKLPWQSTLQVSLTLALVNPVLWYLVDRSKPGFIFSAIVGLSGTALLLGINPEIVPSPATTISNTSSSAAHSQWPSPGGYVSTESIGVGTWIASVLFCSCVCFGNIGRRLALRGKGKTGL